jgi:hypothetical protein
MLFDENFSRVFSDLLNKSKVTCYRISEFTHLDEAYLNRLKNGEKSNPSPETVMKICLALVKFSDKLTIFDIEDLFKTIGRSIISK